MKITIFLFIVLFSSCFLNQKPILIIPETRKDEIFAKFVNPITDKYELPKLREISLSGDDLEVRVWFSEFEIDGFILKRTDRIWTAIAIKEINCKQVGYYYPKDKIYRMGKISLFTPKSGWENTWQNLVDAGILGLHYSYYISMIDETGYMMETNVNGTYRIRFYGSEEKSQEAEQMRKIGEIIANEFGLHNFKIGSLCLEK
ncbi:MAG: hypothetical protein M3Q99_09815 [Acidobacteriota bacterium]|nr:hypothetical protein [Acidobacteriota bacterium]